MGQTISADEKSSYDLVANALNAANKSGSQEYLTGKKIVDFTLEEAAARTLVKNLSIKFNEQSLEQSKHLLKATEGLYDPIVGWSMGVTISQAFTRKKFINRNRFDGDLLTEQFRIFQEAFEAGTSTGTIQPQIIIDGVNVSGLTGPPPIRPFGAFDFASFRSRFLSDFYSASVSQQIPWGATVSLVVRTQHDKPLLPEDPKNRPWTTDWSLNLTVPIPYTKDWGPYGSTDAQIKLAKKAKERAYWQLQSSINTTVLDVTNGYWELVRAVRRLEEATKTRINLEQVTEGVQKMIQAGRAVAFEKNQVDSELARVRVVEEDAWAAYLLASNNLRNLLDYDNDVIILPVRYSSRLNMEFPHKPSEALTQAMEQNPDLKVSQTDVESATIGVKFAKNQSRPDVKLVASVNYDQKEAVFGYRDTAKSLGHIMRPDSKNNFVGIEVNIPWGNKPALARLDIAEQTYLEAEKNAAKTLNVVERSVDDSLSSLNSSRKRVNLARANRDTADKVYKTVTDLWDKGRVPSLAENKSYPAFELLRKNNDLLTANFGLIDAMIDYKKSEASFLSALGTLPMALSSNMKVEVNPEKAKPVQAPPAKKEGEK
ncbi:MAG: TolC family protein [Planctomycetota bacterium]|nr:TolC family protein [Planctomycetota bacterium]